MTNDQINRKMAEIAGKCWHEWEKYIDTSMNLEPWYRCYKCGEVHYGLFSGRSRNPDYCSDLNLVREVELKLVEEGLGHRYESNLIQIHLKKYGEYKIKQINLNFILASAEERCKAIIKTREENPTP